MYLIHIVYDADSFVCKILYFDETKQWMCSNVFCVRTISRLLFHVYSLVTDNVN